MNASSRPERLRVMDTFRNLFYTPLYVAVAGGFLYAEGLDVMLGTVPDGKSAVGVLRSGEADIIQSGIARSLMDMDAGHEDAPLHIAEINQRDGFFLVGRKPAENWKWTNLEGVSLIAVGFTPVPLMSLKAAMKRHGVSEAKVRLIAGLSAAEALSRFRSGGADYIQMPNPQARQLVHEGAGHIATPVGADLGYLCYSSFAATPEFIEIHPETIQKFVNGFYKAQQWLVTSAASEAAARVAPFFPGIGSEVIEASIREYKAQQTWATTPLIGRDGYDAMRDLLIEGGLVKSRAPYERLVRPQFAQRAIGG